MASVVLIINYKVLILFLCPSSGICDIQINPNVILLLLLLLLLLLQTGIPTEKAA